MNIRRLLILAVILIFSNASNLNAQVKNLKYRWVYVSTNLLVDAGVENVQKIMQQASKAGYNAILLNDVKFSRLGEMDKRYFQNVEKIKKTAKELRLDIIPTVCPIGYSEGILAHDPNLTEGVPVKDALFEVKDGQVDLIPDPKVNLVNGDLEQADGDKFIRWGYQDNIGKTTFADKDVYHSGKQSIRMEKIGTVDPQNGLSRIWQSIQVQPNKQYHLSVWIKTENFETPGGVNILTLGSNGRSLSFPTLSVNNTQDWIQYHIVFNSLKSTQVAVYFGIWLGKGGKIWWDDAQLEEVGLLNLVRRDGCPFVVKGEDGKVYAEGQDYQRVVDELMGNTPWPGSYDIYHKPPVIRLTSDSRIKEGEKLRVSFFHSISVYGYQVTCCLTHPKVYTIIEDEIRRVNDLFHPKGFMMSQDEIRVANWCDLCQSRKVTPGKLLADSTKRCIQIINKINPKTEIFTWSDMYDPYHNAVDNYYLVNGTWASSWEGLIPKVTILNWNSMDKRKQSMDFFAKRGNSQILAGYYDGPVDSIRSWIDDGKGIKGIDGVMYTTWQGRYDDMDAFGKAVWEDTKLDK